MIAGHASEMISAEGCSEDETGLISVCGGFPVQCRAAVCLRDRSICGKDTIRIAAMINDVLIKLLGCAKGSKDQNARKEKDRLGYHTDCTLGRY